MKSKHLLTPLLLVLLVDGAAWAQSGGIRPGHYGRLTPEEQVRWSNEETFRASVRRDSSRLRELLHNDYFRFTSRGVRRKAQVVRNWTGAPPTDGSRDAPARVQVRLVNPNLAVLWQDDVHLTAAGDTTHASHETDLWLKEAGRWQLYAVASQREQLGPAVSAIGQAAARRNRAYAARDTAALSALSTPDFRMSSGAGSFGGRSANLRGLSQQFARRPGLTLVLTPETVTAGNGFGAEAGTWTETWTAPNGSVKLTGSYLVQWISAPDGWRQRDVLLIPTACEGAGCQ